MRRLVLTTAIFIASINTGFAQSTAPVFRSLTTEPSMTLTQPAPAAPALPAAPVSRYGEVIDSVGGDAIPALPLEAVKENGITYISGGIGDEEEAQLKAQEELYNLRLQITGLSGEYLSDIALTLKNDQDATLLTVADAGPYVYLQVPAGNYKVDVVSPQGTRKNLSLKIPANSAVKTQVRL